MNKQQTEVINEIYERTTRGRVQLTQQLERLRNRKHDDGSRLEDGRLSSIARIEELIAFQSRVIETTNELLLGVNN